MIPVISSIRVDLPGGMWTPKVSGDFQEGDPQTTNFWVEGKVDIKELAGHLKLFLTDTRIKKRKLFLTEKEKEEVKKTYFEKVETKDKENLEEGKEPLTADAKEARDKEGLELALKEAESKKDVPIPSRLNIFLTRRKPKQKMGDAHKNGSRVHCTGNTDGLFGKAETLGTFSVPLKDIPDALGYLGLVVLKLPDDPPKTNDPVIYGLVKLQSARARKTKTMSALHLTEVAESLFKVLTAAESGPNKQSAEDNIKPLHYYSSMANKAWLSLQVPLDEEIEFEALSKMLDNVNVFLVDAQVHRLFEAVDVDGSGEMGMLEFENFLMAYDIMGSAGADLAALDIYETLKFYPDTKKLDEFGNHDGMDLSGFLEAAEMLGVAPDTTHEELVRAFASGAGVKERQIESTYLTHDQFKKAWIKVCDMGAEMKKRKLKYDSNILAAARNRDRLYRIITDQETAYMANLKSINEIVETVKKNRRQRTDERKRAHNAHKDSLLHAAHKFQAIRGQEKRLLQKQEADEKNKKRFEERALRAKLLAQQQENREKARLEVLGNRLETEKLRMDEIRSQGLDKIDISIQGLRTIPGNLYDNVAAQTKLSYLVSVDMSRNMLESLPEKNFCYWLGEVKRWKLSQNRLVRLPEDIGYMFKMEILEIDSNKIASIPSDIGKMTALQRLDISNNHLTLLPESLGQCQALRYLYAHSNNLQLLPSSIGGCFRLEYVDVSRNRIRELPEDMGHLASLVHLDLNTNRIGHLPRDLGNSSKLSYLDVSTNILVFLPESFSKLKALEICNLENNELIMQPDRFNQCTSLQILKLKKNQTMHITADIGACKLLTKLDVSCNKLEDIPAEVGLLTCIQEIDISYNRMTSIPIELGSCGMLQKLVMKHNLIDGCFPNTLGLVQSLRSLEISFNKINELPRSIIGLKQLESLVAERCLLSTLPDTMIHLDKLELLDLSNNLFTRFPIELSAMKTLKILNLSNNSIPLLPRNINAMVRLDALILKRNQLRALPVEFVEVFESVAEVDLDTNPWTDLPPRWGRLWENKHATEGPRGYALTEAVDFLYGMQAFYDAAEDIWQEMGVFHYTHRLGFSDFLDELRKRIPKTWHDGLIEYVKHVYFSARQAGVFPRWYSLEGRDDFVAERAQMQQVDAQRREVNVQMSRAEAKERAERMAKVYDVEPLKRADRGEAIATEHAVNEQVLQKMALAALHHCVTDREKKNAEKAARKELQQQRIVKAETERLMEILDADRRSRIRVEERAAAVALKKAKKKDKKK